MRRGSSLGGRIDYSRAFQALIPPKKVARIWCGACGADIGVAVQDIEKRGQIRMSAIDFAEGRQSATGGEIQCQSCGAGLGMRLKVRVQLDWQQH